MDKMNLDEMIAFYSEELMKMKRTSRESNEFAKTDIPQQPVENAENEEEGEDVDTRQEKFAIEEDLPRFPYTEDPEEQAEQPDETARAQNEEVPLSYANFFARVFSGDSAFPVLGAKIILKRNDELYKVLTTSASGETQKIKIASYKKENSLEPEGENQRCDYLADVYADGFVTQKDLLVSAVGESEIILAVQMTPVSERID